jgi:hypothetical protein
MKGQAFGFSHFEGGVKINGDRNGKWSGGKASIIDVGDRGCLKSEWDTWAKEKERSPLPFPLLLDVPVGNITN